MSTGIVDRLRGIVGENRVATDPDVLAPRLVDERGRYQGIAACVVSPGSVAEVAAVVAACAEARTPVVAQGGNTGLCGAATPDVASTVLVDVGRLRAVRDVDPDNDTMTLECGFTVAEAGAVAAGIDRLFPLRFGADGTATLGGALATNAGGSNVLRYGMVRDLTLGVEVVMADGRVLDDLRGLRKDNTGYDLRDLFVGSEGTLGVITAATFALFPRPRATVTAVAAVTGADRAAALHRRLRTATDRRLSAFEWMSEESLRLVDQFVPDERVPYRDTEVVLVEVTSSGSEATLTDLVVDALSEAAEAGEVTDAAVAPSESAAAEMWATRDAIPEAGKRAGGALKHDVSLPLSAVPEFLCRAGEAVRAVVPDVVISAFGHLGDGNIHYNLLSPSAPGSLSELEEELTGAIFDTVHALGGSFSAEHGIGRLRVGELWRRGDPVAVETMARIKAALDPQNILNPGVIVPVDATADLERP